MAAAAEAKDNLSEKVPACHASISSPLNESAAKLCIFETRRKCGLFSFFPNLLIGRQPRTHIYRSRKRTVETEKESMLGILLFTTLDNLLGAGRKGVMMKHVVGGEVQREMGW